jgi:putative colanic acid biosynthesis acetyltransferase WcaF
VTDRSSSSPILQNLAHYQLPPDWSPGAPVCAQTLWFLFGSPLVANRWLPGSGWRSWLLCVFGATIGPGCRIKPGFRVKFPWRLTCGSDCWLGEDAWIDNLAAVTLGDRVVLSQGCYCCTGNHNFREPSFRLLIRPITIGSDVWVGAKVVLAPGTVVGDGAVLGLAAVVSGSVPPRAVMRGNPAVVTGQR